MAEKNNKPSSITNGKDVEFTELVTFKPKQGDEITIAVGEDGRVAFRKGDDVLVGRPDEWYDAMACYVDDNGSNLKLHKN